MVAGRGFEPPDPPGYEPDELPNCSTPRYAFLRCYNIIYHLFAFVNRNFQKKSIIFTFDLKIFCASDKISI